MTTRDRSAAAPARILLLEVADDAAAAVLAALHSGGTDYDVQRAADRGTYLAALARRPAALVLAGGPLPDLPRAAAASLARERWPEVPVVAVVGVGDADDGSVTDAVSRHALAQLPRRVERALLEARERAHCDRAEALLRLAADAGGFGLWDVDAETGAIRLDARMRALLGADEKAPPATLDETIARCVLPSGRAAATQAFAAALADGQPFAVTLQANAGAVAVQGRRLEGPDRRLQLSGIARPLAAGAAAAWNLSPELMLVARPGDATLLALNPAWQRLLGWRPKALIGTSFIDRVQADDQPLVRDAFARFAAGERPPRIDIRLLRRQGGTRWLRWSGELADDGCVHAFGRDITEERAAALELAAANQALRAQITERRRIETTLGQAQRLEAVGELTAGVAHDFNNLLTVVLSNVSLIRLLLARQAHATDERVLQRLQSMAGAAERGGKLTGQLLAFARRQRLEPTVLDLNDVVGGMRELLQTTVGGSVRLETLLQQPLWRALADPTQLQLIVLNLGVNARDAMPGGGTLTVQTRNTTLAAAPLRPEEPEPGDYVQLTVADTGSGIAADVLPRVFEPFFTTKDAGTASGLGLAQVYGFAKQSGGGVRIDSSPGAGTAVHVYMPRVTPAAATPEPPAGSAALPRPAGASQRRRLLLVDDDAAVREATAELLALSGYAVQQAASADEALQLADVDDAIDLVLADFAMPGMNGATLRRLLRLRRPHLPVVIVTGYADQQALHDVGDEMVLVKPVSERALLEKLRGLLA